MSYTKHNYKKGDELLASQLNDMDDQIALNEQTADTLVTVSNTQPSAAKNRVWVKATPSEIEIPTMEDHNELSRHFSDIAEEQTTSIKPSTQGVTRYQTNGYLRRNDGALVPHDSYWVYTFVTTDAINVFYPNPVGWNQIAVYNGDAFDTTKFVVCKASSASDLPTEQNPLSIASGMTVAVCISANATFELSVLSGHYVIKLQSKPKIKISPQYATSFFVDVLDEKSDKYIRYWFYHITFIDTMSYGSGQTKDVITNDVWFNNNIVDESGNLIFQGNTNFINALDETGHEGHVGAGHGCCVMDCYQFFADGMPFEPSSMVVPIECTSFRFVIKAKHYKIDDAITTSSVHAMPVLDENGDPVVTSVWLYDGTWTVNNRVESRNHLDIVENNIKFRQCHGGMICGFYPNIDNIMLSGRKGLYWNEISESGGTFTNTDESKSGLILISSLTTSVIADSATLFGNNYVAKQYFWQDDPAQYGKENVLAWMPPNSDNRLKVYLMPCVCSESTALISEGKTIDVFNEGDAIDVRMVRTIEITPN